MTDTPQPQRSGAWPIEHPVDIDADATEQARAEQQAEQEYGEWYARHWGAVAWNELAFDITRLGAAIWEKR